MAANKIKGLTVEIGGDTTKLGKALENVNKKSRDLSSELGEINRMLKLDPGNADLLAQKQKVLADAVNETSKKLGILREAEKQVQEQFERGEVSEEQVRALKREILALVKKLQNYENAARETDAAIENLGDSSDDLGDDTEEAAKGLDEMADKADEAGDASDGLDSKLGNLALGGLKLLVTGVTAALGALVGSAEASREYRAEMGKLDAAFKSSGHSSEVATSTYKELQGVIGETDQSVEAAQQIALLADSEKDAAQWADLAAGVVGKFGDALQPETFYESANETLKLGEATGAYTQMLEGCGLSVEEFNAGLAACGTEAEKQAYMLKVTEGALGAAGEAYRENNAEVIRANEANEAWAASMAEVGASVEPILTDVKLLGASLLSDLVPNIKGVTEAFRGMLNGDEGAAANLGKSLSGIFTQILTKITELLPAVAEMAVSLVTTLVSSIVSALPQLLDTLVQVVLAIVQGIAAAIPQIIKALTSVIPQLLQVLADAIPQVVQALTTAIPQIVTALVNGLLTAIPQLIQGAMQLLMAIVNAIPQIIPPLVAAIPRIVTALVDGLLVAIPLLIQGTMQLLMAIVEAIPQIIPPLVAAIPQIIITLVDGLLVAIPQLVDGAVQLLNAIIDAIPILIQALVPEIPGIVHTIVTQLLRLTPTLLDACITLLMALIEAIPEICKMLVKEAPAILKAILGVLKELPRLIWGVLSQVIVKVGNWIGEMTGKGKDAGVKFLNSVVQFFTQLPGKIWTWLTNVINNVTSWATNLASKARSAGSNFINAVLNFIKTLPSKVWTWLSNVVSKVTSWGTSLVSKGRSAVQKLVNTVVNTVKTLPSKMMSAGKNLVQGLWSGISGAYTWLKNKIKGWVGNVTDFIKKLFGINSPSKKTEWMGEMLDEGLAVGVEGNEDAPLDAMSRLSEGMLDEADSLNGVTLERRINNTFGEKAGATSYDNGILAKLDQLLVAIKQGQSIYLDGDALVGSTAARYDNTLGQRRVLAERGAL